MRVEQFKPKFKSLDSDIDALAYMLAQDQSKRKNQGLLPLDYFKDQKEKNVPWYVMEKYIQYGHIDKLISSMCRVGWFRSDALKTQGKIDGLSEFHYLGKRLLELDDIQGWLKIWWSFVIGHRNYAKQLSASPGRGPSDPDVIYAKRLSLHNMVCFKKMLKKIHDSCVLDEDIEQITQEIKKMKRSLENSKKSAGLVR